MDVSALDSAESWLAVIWWAKLAAAGLVALGVAMEFGGDWISRPFEKTIEDARKLELAELHKQSDEAKVETARLSKEAEVARKETAEAQLQLQQMRFPRQLDTDKFKAEIAPISPQFFEVLYDQSAADGSSLAFQIFVALRIAEWITDQKLPAPLTPQQGPPALSDIYKLLPLTQQSGGSAWGVSVVTKGPISDDRNTPEGKLCDALLASVASPVQIVGCGKDEMMPVGKIRIIVGPKLP